jgi:protein-L-isoaspartate(D-aspartate) O-methyltransferase
MARLDPQPGEHVVHIGAGTGYYTAILAELAGAQGRITAIEYDPGLAALAAKNLGMLPNVEVVQGDGTRLDFDPADGIYVNAGVTHPLARWLDRLRDRGRMVLPMTAPRRRTPARPGPRWTGVVFLIRRRGEQFAAHRISAVAIYPCQGARDRAERALARSLKIGGAERVRHLYRHRELPAEQCWLQGDGWCLAYAN